MLCRDGGGVTRDAEGKDPVPVRQRAVPVGGRWNYSRGSACVPTEEGCAESRGFAGRWGWWNGVEVAVGDVFWDGPDAAKGGLMGLIC